MVLKPDQQPLNLAIACTLTPGELRDASADLLPGLAAQATEIRALDGTEDEGFALRFDAAAEQLAGIARVIDRERTCCAFLRFRVMVEPAGGPITLELTGPAGTKQFLVSLLFP